MLTACFVVKYIKLKTIGYNMSVHKRKSNSTNKKVLYTVYWSFFQLSHIDWTNIAPSIFCYINSRHIQHELYVKRSLSLQNIVATSVLFMGQEDLATCYSHWVNMQH